MQNTNISRRRIVIASYIDISCNKEVVLDLKIKDLSLLECTVMGVELGKFIEKYGDQSIVKLLPEDSRFFARVLTSLYHRAGIFTKRELIDFPRQIQGNS